MKNLNGYTRNYKDIIILFSRFTKYPLNPRNFFILENNLPYGNWCTGVEHARGLADCTELENGATSTLMLVRP